ncbi:MAG: hypothetical protein JXA03_03760 [Bacteroidales bacterium]|nr:hypothetical protein [Bacteroidales bacterium]
MIRFIHIWPWFFILAGIVLHSGCKKDNGSEGDIPNVYVNFTLYPNSLNYIAVSNYIYVNNQGYRGIIVFRTDLYTFMAYERTCPFDPGNDCAQVEVEPSNITAVDSCCMTQYNLINGSAFSGPGTLPLKQYKTSFDGDILIIYN